MGTGGEHLSSLDLRVTKRLLPLIPGGLVVERVLPEPDRVTVVARSRLPTSPCPDCRAPSSRVHSRYERRLADLPWQGRPVAVRLRARRFFCAEPACPRRTFAERLPALPPGAASASPTSSARSPSPSAARREPGSRRGSPCPPAPTRSCGSPGPRHAPSRRCRARSG